MRMHGARRLLMTWVSLALPALAESVEAREEARHPTGTTVQAQVDVAPSPSDDRRPVGQGRLGNGLRYAIMPRRGYEPGVGLLMRSEGGFIAEQRPGERGLAHLIEHLLLVSPTGRAPDDLRHMLRIGLPLTLPAPSAGTTSWRETNLFVSTRTTRTADLDTLLTLFQELASDLTFRSDAVDGQRADVMREMAERKPGNDVYASYIAAVAPGSPNDVINAQNSDDVPTAGVETIRALYHRLYRPETMMIVIVGDVDAAPIEALIRKRFGAWRGVGPAPGRRLAASFRPDRIAPISVSHLQEGRSSAMVTVVTPTPRPSTTRKGQARAMLMDMLATRAVNNRLALAQLGHPPGKYGMFIENGEQGHRQIMLWDNFAPGLWRPAVADLKKAACDLDTVGLSEAEWAAAKRDVVGDLERRTREMAGMPNVELAKDLSHAIADGRDLIPPDELLGHARTGLPAITARVANDWWRRQWRAGVEHLRVESPELAQVRNPEAAIRGVADEAVRHAGCKVRRS